MMDDGLGAPNCPDCLRTMEPVVTAWWCEDCKIARAADGEISRRGHLR